MTRLFGQEPAGNAVYGTHGQGFSLIEVLIALLVLSIGLLGAAGLQVGGLVATRGAALRSQANLLAYDMADRMRTNSAGVAAGWYDDRGGVSAPPQPADITPADPHCMVGGCTPADLAQYDMHAWLVALAQILPAGRGAVKRDAENSDFLITVAWDEARNGGADSCLSRGQAPVPGKAYLACFQMSLSP